MSITARQAFTARQPESGVKRITDYLNELSARQRLATWENDVLDFEYRSRGRNAMRAAHESKRAIRHLLGDAKGMNGFGALVLLSAISSHF